MNALSQDLLARIVRLNPDGITVCERSGEDWLVLSVNDAFEQLTGYGEQDVKGRDLRLLQGGDRDQENRQRIRAAFANHNACRVLLRNYRKDGTQFWNEMTLTPVKDGAGQVTHYIGFHRDAGDRLRFDAKPSGAARDNFITTGTYPSLLSVLRDDRITGLFNRGYFEELMRRDWAIALREERRLALLIVDIDSLGAYNDTFGRSAGDACIKRVGRAIAGCLKRSSDLTARLEGGTIIALMHGLTQDQALPFANTILERVRELHIHHPKSAVQRYVTASAGVVGLVPAGEGKPEQMIESARAALQEAKGGGRNRAVGAPG